MTMITSWDLFDDLGGAQDEMLRWNGMRARRPGPPADGGTTTPAGGPAAHICERGDASPSVELPSTGTGHLEITFQALRRCHV